MPSVARETIFSNLFTLLQGVILPSPLPRTWVQSGRRLLVWDEVAAANQPAMFMHQGPQTVTAPDIPLNQWRLTAQVWVYFRADGSHAQAVPPDILVNGILDAVDTALEANPPGYRQTLGGSVYHCSVSGQVAFDSGLIDGQGVIVIPIEIITGM